MEKPDKKQVISYSNEVKRKLIHLSSLWMPAAIYFMPRPSVVIIFAGLVLLMIAFEVVRRQHHWLSSLVNYFFLPVLRHSEAGKLASATFGIIATFICSIVFSQVIAITALSLMIVADAAAALIGRRYGKKIILPGKTMEGTLAFIAASVLTVYIIGCLLPSENYYILAIIAVIVATITELFSHRLKIDDNLSIPLATGSVLYAASFII